MVEAETAAVTIIPVARLIPNVAAHAQPELGTAQPAARIVRSETMGLQIGAGENHEFDAVAFEAPTRHDCRQRLPSGDVVGARLIAVAAPRKQKLQREALAGKTVRRPQQSAMDETTVPPEVKTAEKQIMIGALAVRFRLRERAIHATNYRDRCDERSCNP